VDRAPSKLLLLIVGGSRQNRRTAALLFKKSDFETLRTREEMSRLCAVALPQSRRSVHRIGLALSGGGSRAIAFHLGCMRALHDRGILDQVRVISAVSGGSVIAGMYAYGQGTFEEFERRVVELLRRGLTGSVLRRAFFSPRIIGTALTMLIAGTAALGATFARSVVGTASRFLSRDSRGSLSKGQQIQPPFKRWMSRTLAFENALRVRLFGDLKLTDRRRDGIDVVFNACELRTGTSFRFGSRESACWRFGKIRENDIRVSLAVAASAGYPAFFPAIDTEMTFTDQAGEKKERVIITDGGVYDNLGLSCLQPGRSEDFSSNVFSSDYLICCDAGPGQFGDHVYRSGGPVA
jgi:NTE family protein